MKTGARERIYRNSIVHNARHGLDDSPRETGSVPGAGPGRSRCRARHAASDDQREHALHHDTGNEHQPDALRRHETAEQREANEPDKRRGDDRELIAAPALH